MINSIEQSNKSDRDVSDWTATQRTLLSFERESEKNELTDKINSLSAKDCESAGLSLLSMSITAITSALFGRCSMSLMRSNKKLLLRTFKVGDEVVIYCPKLKNTPDFFSVDGIVVKLFPESIEVVCDEVDEGVFDGPIRIDMRANDSTHQKYMAVLGDLEISSSPLVNLLFGKMDLESLTSKNAGKNDSSVDKLSLKEKEIEFINSKLNESQKKAVTESLQTKQVSLIHGPPGTGKTSTVVEVIQQSALMRQRVLVCAPSNVAVDNILERLISSKDSISLGKKKSPHHKLTFVRLGHPARVSQGNARYCLDALIASHGGTDIVSDVRSEIDGLQKELSKCGRKNRSKRREIQTEVRILCKEARKRQEAVVKDIMRGVDIVLCTCVTAGSRLLKGLVFDILIIDEAAQALEVSCWIPMMIATRCILVGDHKQLPPTVKSAQATSSGLAVTLFERVMNCKNFLKAGLVHLLNTQYRMNSSICDWSSHHMYGGQLLSHHSVSCRTVSDVLQARAASAGLGAIVKECSTDSCHAVPSDTADVSPEGSLCYEESGVLPVVLVLDTAGSDMNEEVCNEGSRSNIGEANLVLQHVLYLLDVVHVQPSDIGVITPYSGQLGVLKQLFAAHGETDTRMSSVDVKTIDGFQGGEKECIVISMVRSNPKRQVGFLGDRRRINVAVTRARVHLAIICDVDTCSNDAFIRTLLDHISLVGEHRSVFEVDYAACSLPDRCPTVSYPPPVTALIPTQHKSIGDIHAGNKAQQSASRVVSGSKGNQSSASASVSVRGPAVKGLNSQAASSKCVDYPRELKRLIAEFKSRSVPIIEGVVELMGKDAEGVEGVEGAVSIEVKRVQAMGSEEEIASLHCEAAATLMRFPITLDSFCRRIVHEVATEFGLYHRSVGAAPRYIEVSSEPFVAGDGDGDGGVEISESNKVIIDRSSHHKHNDDDSDVGEESSSDNDSACLPPHNPSSSKDTLLNNPAFDELRSIRAAKHSLSKELPASNSNSKAKAKAKAVLTEKAAAKKVGKDGSDKGTVKEAWRECEGPQGEPLSDFDLLERAIMENKVKEIGCGDRMDISSLI